MGVRESRDVSAVKGANIRRQTKLLFAALIFSILFLAACGDDTPTASPGAGAPPPPPPPGQPDLKIAITSVAPDGFGDADVNFTISNVGTGPTDGTAFFVDFFANPGIAPVLGDLTLLEFTLIAPVIAAGGTFPDTMFISLGGFLTGTAYVIVDSTEAIIEADETNNVSAAFGW